MSFNLWKVLSFVFIFSLTSQMTGYCNDLIDRLAVIKSEALTQSQYYQNLKELALFVADGKAETELEDANKAKKFLKDYQNVMVSFRKNSFPFALVEVIHPEELAYFEVLSKYEVAIEVQKIELYWRALFQLVNSIELFYQSKDVSEIQKEKLLKAALAKLNEDLERNIQLTLPEVLEQCRASIPEVYPEVKISSHFLTAMHRFYVDRDQLNADNIKALYILENLQKVSMVGCEASLHIKLASNPGFIKAMEQLISKTTPYHFYYNDWIALELVQRNLRQALREDKPLSEVSQSRVGTEKYLVDRIYLKSNERLDHARKLILGNRIRKGNKARLTSARTFTFDKDEEAKILNELVQSLTASFKMGKFFVPFDPTQSSGQKGEVSSTEIGPSALTDKTEEQDSPKVETPKIGLKAEEAPRHSDPFIEKTSTSSLASPSEKEEELESFDYEAWVIAERRKTRERLDGAHSVAPLSAPTSKEGETPVEALPVIRLTGAAARTLQSGIRFDAYQIRNRDFTEFLRQIGGGLLKNKGNGSEMKYFLPDYTRRGAPVSYKEYRIDFSHNGSKPMNPVALWKFFGFSLRDSGITSCKLELDFDR